MDKETKARVRILLKIGRRLTEDCPDMAASFETKTGEFQSVKALEDPMGEEPSEVSEEKS